MKTILTLQQWGENLHGAGRDYEDVLYITLSTGISAGLVQDDNLVSGNGNFGKIGRYVLEDGGTWEELCSGESIPETFKAYSDGKFDVESAEEVFELAEDGNYEAEIYVKEFLGRINAKGVANACLSYGPDVVIFGGSVALENPRIVEDISDQFDGFYPDNYENPDLAVAELGQDSELYGAGEL